MSGNILRLKAQGCLNRHGVPSPPQDRPYAKPTPAPPDPQTRVLLFEPLTPFPSVKGSACAGTVVDSLSLGFHVDRTLGYVVHNIVEQG